METTTLDLAPACAEAARVVAGVRDDQLNDPTPCEGTSVAGMLDHFVGFTLAFRLGAEKQPQSGGPSASAEHLAPDWRTRLPEQLHALVAAWRDPAAWEGVTEVGGVQLPGGAMGVVAVNEVLVHGWDLAAATGQNYRADPASAQRCLEFVVDFAAGAPEARNAMYGPVVPVAGDAPVMDQLLGQTGQGPGPVAADGAIGAICDRMVTHWCDWCAAQPSAVVAPPLDCWPWSSKACTQRRRRRCGSCSPWASPLSWPTRGRS